ncbi:MAG: ATP-binding cassette domain-containing protein [Myxococcales bacterium]|nr:ATP-binding cassette domain-containing protein [Myxococcales bacterium]
MSDRPAIDVRDLDFSYSTEPPSRQPPVLRRLSLVVPRGVRCLLVGANGAGKTTLLSLLAGKHMIDDDAVLVLGCPAFSDTSLVDRVAFLGGRFPFDVDIGVDEILARRTSADPARLGQLIAVLGVQPRWRMSRVSDGQRRRVQILLSLLQPSELLLLDEVTTDLDVIARADLLAFLRRETEERGATILYATHILDGLDAWATHLAFLDQGAIRLMSRLDAIVEYLDLQRRGASSPLLRLVEEWLRRA